MGAPNKAGREATSGLLDNLDQAKERIRGVADAWDVEFPDPTLAGLARARVHLVRALARVDSLIDALGVA